ncbi:MAG: uroporphyrinogen decarboxylase [Gammaproteobacteria bacterium]
MIQNDTFLKALRRELTPHTPIWLMRQAGRYLPEYRHLRQQAKDFLTLCKTPELACEITLQPLARFPLDAAIIFSDILTIPDAMGLGLKFIEQTGPHFERPLRSAQAVQALRKPDLNDLNYVFEAIQLTKQALADKVPLIGFSGSPWTLATYMVEGGSSKTFSIIKKWLFNDPNSLSQLLELLAETVTEYLLAQILAGADVVMLFDTWGGILAAQDYQTFSLHYMNQIVKNIQQQKPTVPIILFTKNGGQWLKQIAETGCDAIGLDWTTDIGLARAQVGQHVALQGNLDPAALYADPLHVQQQAKRILESYGNHPGHIFNLGHGIQPDTPVDHVAALVDFVHAWSPSV